MSSPILFLLPFFILYLPIQYWIGSKGIGGVILTGILLCVPILFWFQKRRSQMSFPSSILPGILIFYWSLFIFTEGIFLHLHRVRLLFFRRLRLYGSDENDRPYDRRKILSDPILRFE